MYKVIGVEKREGEYQGKAYCNYLIHCVSDRSSLEGAAIDTFKVSKKNYDNILFNHNLTSLLDYQFSMPYYDVYKKVVDLH